MIVRKADRLSHINEYYFSKKLEEIRLMNASGEQVINLGIGKPDLPPPSSAISALSNVTLDHDIHGYQGYRGIPELRAQFSQWYQQQYQVDLDPDQEILPLIGSKEGILHVSMSFLNPGDQVLIPNPGYAAYRNVSKLCGAEPIEYLLNEENNWLPYLELIEQSDLSKVKIMWINYPHMPTGATASQTDLEKIVQFCKEHHILLCHDNPYSFTLNENPISILSIPGAKEVAIELNSLSKSHNISGWRIGMVAGRQEYISAILQFKSNMDSGMYKGLQLGAIEALKESQKWFTSQNEILQERKKEVESILRLLKCQYQKDQSGLFVWAKVNNRYSSGASLSDEILQNARVFITPGKIFGSNGTQYIRVSLCQPVEVIKEAKNRIENHIMTQPC